MLVPCILYALELQAIVSCLEYMLATELRFSGGTGKLLTADPSLQPALDYFMFGSFIIRKAAQSNASLYHQLILFTKR